LTSLAALSPRFTLPEDSVDFLMLLLAVGLALLTWGLVRLCEKV
jgi:hypothetical protein